VVTNCVDEQLTARKDLVDRRHRGRRVHRRPDGFLVWLFAGLFVVGLAASILSGRWLAHLRRQPEVAAAPRILKGN